MNVLTSFKEYRDWCTEQNRYQHAKSVLLSYELMNFTYLDCLIAVAGRSGIPHCYVGELAEILFARSRRGKVSLVTALDRFVETYTGRLVDRTADTRRMRIVMGEYP